MKKILDKYANEVSGLKSLNSYRTNQLATDAAAEIHEQVELNQVKKKSATKPAASAAAAAPTKSRPTGRNSATRNETDDIDNQFEGGDDDVESNNEQCNEQDDWMGQFE